MRERPLTGELLVYAGLLLASLPARLITMRSSLWLDEAWVANSVLSPSWKEMFYYPPWLQSSPALFLTLTRLLTRLFGPAEPALRLLPVLAGIMAIPLLAIALRKIFNPAAALCGTTLVIVNLWAVRYAQQVKQYGSDLFAGALLFFLVTRYCARPDRRNFTLLVGGFFVVSFLANTVLFMGPSVVAAVALEPLWRRPADLRWKRLGIAIASLILCGALNYLIFIRPNRGPSLVAYWAARCLDPTHPLASARSLFGSFGELLASRAFPVTFYLGGLLVLAMLAGAVVASIGAARGTPKAVLVLLLGPLPLGVAIGFSLLGLYPLLRSPRMLLWALPACAALLAAILDPLCKAFRQAAFYAAALACIAALLGLYFVDTHYPRPNERNREAMRLLQQSIGPNDNLYVHGRMREQYDYYSRLLGWAARRVYVGNVDVPCCSRNAAISLIGSSLRDYAEDLHRAAAGVQPSGQLWMLLPSREQAVTIAAIPGLMQQQACAETHREGFDLSLVVAYRCR